MHHLYNVMKHDRMSFLLLVVFKYILYMKHKKNLHKMCVVTAPDAHTQRETDRQIEKETDRQRDRNRKTDRQTQRERERERDGANMQRK